MVEDRSHQPPQMGDREGQEAYLSILSDHEGPIVELLGLSDVRRRGWRRVSVRAGGVAPVRAGSSLWRGWGG